MIHMGLYLIHRFIKSVSHKFKVSESELRDLGPSSQAGQGESYQDLPEFCQCYLCECGQKIDRKTRFKDWEPTTLGPSTRTVGHVPCGVMVGDLGFPKFQGNICPECGRIRNPKSYKHKDPRCNRDLSRFISLVTY